MRLVIAAMHEEVKAIIQNIQPKNKLYKLPYQDTYLIVSGIGKVNAASTLATVLAKHKIVQIFNLGFAGATPPYQTNDLVLIEGAAYHDFDLTIFGYEKGQVPGYPTEFKSDIASFMRAKTLLPEAKIGKLFTGDYFMTTPRTESYLADMEGASLYQVAYQHQVPIISIKVVSDVIGSSNYLESYKQFEANEGSIILKTILDCFFREE